MEYVIADTHWWHRRILDYESRPFKNVEEMNQALIDNWNNIVEPIDVVYHLGDVSFTNNEKTKEIIQQLNGEKILIMGNHDRRKTVTWWENTGFTMATKKPLVLIDKGVNVVLSHEPVDNLEDYGNDIINIHGHVHSNIKNLPLVSHRCVSVEVTNFKPLPIDYVVSLRYALWLNEKYF